MLSGYYITMLHTFLHGFVLDNKAADSNPAKVGHSSFMYSQYCDSLV